MPSALQRFSLADLDRVYYHGKPIPDDEIAAVKHLGYWDARQAQDWGLPWHRHQPAIAAAAQPVQGTGRTARPGIEQRATVDCDFLEQLKADPVKLRQPWTVKLMAKSCGLGEARFADYCKEIVNMSPSVYLQYCRLQRAVYLLREENTLTIRQVAEQIGFTSARYFATVFNEHYHCTPQQFREQAG